MELNTVLMQLPEGYNASVEELPGVSAKADTLEEAWAKLRQAVERILGAVRSELDHGEQLLWVGQPRPNRFARATIPLVLFGIPWTAFTIFWTVMAAWGAGSQAPQDGLEMLFCLVFPLWGVPFVLAGFGMLSSPYWYRRIAKRTCYALTDRRAILFEAGFFGSVEVRSYRPPALAKMVRRDFAGGSGDLIFEEPGRAQDGTSTKSTIGDLGHGFMGINNVREIEELVRKALPSDSNS